MRGLLTSCLLLFAAPAFAQASLEASRAQEQSARAAVGEVRSRQMAARAQLNALAAKIETLKAASKGKLLRGGELELALRRSQELSAELTGLATELSTAEAAQTEHQRSLLSALSSELSALSGRLEGEKDRSARQALYGKMRALRAEREQVRAALPESGAQAEMPSRSDSEDPEDLLEQADMLRDREDKVRRELAALDKLIAERREERELDRRMSEFMGDEALFDDQDRRFRLRKDSFERVSRTEGSQVFGANNSLAPASAATSGGADLSGATAMPTSARDLNQAEKSASPSLNETLIPRSTAASDARVTIGDPARGNGYAGDELEQLQAQRAKLGGLSEELRQKAKRLEERARSLR